MTPHPAQPRPAPRRRPARRGLTLVEVTFSVVIMALLLATAMGTIGGAARTRLVQRDRAKGLAIARQLLAEIQQGLYKGAGTTTLGPEAGQARAAYDDVDDYAGLSECPPAYADGVAVTGYTGWRRAVTVQWVSPTDPSTVVTSDQGLKRITVTVTAPDGKATTLTALRSKYDAYEQTLTAQTSYVSWVGVTVQCGSDSNARSTQAVAPANLVPAQ
ncbi:MAG TPA: prepilin-type N-terminal cleavage/methylation domain-containing protein [Humisphaera sp.]